MLSGDRRPALAFSKPDFTRDSEKDIDREIEQLAQKFEENSKRWKQEREELDNLRSVARKGNGRQRSSSAFLDAGFRDSEKDIDREIEQLAQKFEENSKRWKQEREELDNLRRLDLEEIEKSRERTQKILDVATGVSAGFFLVGIASYNNLI
uniref:DUF632 domain-containing protein n=1 Tax=Oryza rufipogon TaxID=4529 RepID=A0A0E0Q3Z2_ORYRU